MKCWFGEVNNGKMILNKIGRIVEEEWLKTSELRKNVDLDYYVIMPNHLHGNIMINGSELESVVEPHRDAALRRVDNNLSNIIKGFKGSCTNKIHFSGI
jgi:hypothetical protein